jgi:hypothetical protein
MKIKNISYSFIIFALICFAGNAQVRQPHSLYFMETIPQTVQMNPAHQPRANSYVILPANFNVDLFSDIAVKNLLQEQNGKWYTPFEQEYDYKQLWYSVGKKATMINLAADIDIIGFGKRTGKGYLSVGISQHFNGNISLPSHLFKITEDFFPDNSTFDFSPLRLKAMMYTQANIGYSRKFGEKLTLGINAKPMIGQVGVITRLQKFELTTSAEEWRLSGKGEVHLSSPMMIRQDSEDKITTEDISEGLDAMEVVKNFAGFKNRGIAFDFGAAYEIDERLTISAALTNLGFISWNANTSGITFPGGDFKYKGFEYDVSKDDDENSNFFDNILDSITNGLKGKVNNDKFKTTFAPTINAGASYKFTKSVSAGLMSRSVLWQNGIRQSFNLSVYVQPYSFLAFNAGATYQVKGNAYLGGGFMFHFLRVFQFHLLMDYIPVYYSTLQINDGGKIPIPERQKSFTYRAGLNLVFGRHGYVDKPMLDKGKSSWN